MKLTTASFRGMAPRISNRLLPPEASAQAINARLLNGSLTPWKRPLFGETFSNAGPVRTIFKLDDAWLSFEDDVECARGTILGDTDFRTYITGLDVPRFTTKELAVTQTGGSPPYPIETRPLGVPGPDDVPQLALSVDPGTEGGITIINPGAEEGDDTGWTQTTPDLTVYTNGDIPGINAQSGTKWFYGGTGSSGEYYQSFTADAEGVAVGQNLTLSWYQATGAAGSQAQLGLRFYDSGVNLVGEQFAEMTAPSPANTWAQRSVTFQVPADTVTFRIVMKFLNVGGGVTDAYIDTIALSVASVDYFSDGTDLSTWTLGPQSTRDNAYRTTVQQDIGGVQGSVFVWRSDRATGYIYRRFGYDDAASFRVEWSGRLNYSDAYFQCAVGANGGVGDIISVRQARVEKGSISSYDGGGSGYSTLANFSGPTAINDDWFRVVLAGARSGTGQFALTVTVTNLSTGVVVCDAASTTISSTGDQLLFRYYSGGDNSGQRGYLDDILSSIVPNAPTDSTETTLTSYVYRYVNDFGEASVPSLPSRIIQRASSGVTVTVTTDTTIPTGISLDYGITYKQIYRAATGSAGTVYRFVAEIPLAQADYVDVLDDDELGEVLDSEDWDLPPDDLRYILALPNGIMCGASKNQLCFSVQTRPHAWPVGFRLPTDTNITGLGNIDNAVIVGTKSFVYTASGNSPESYSMSKPGAPHACQSARSFAYLLRVGCVFAGPDGLMAANGATEVQNLTEGIFTREQWQALDPSTITAVSHDDMYFWWYGSTIPETGTGPVDSNVTFDPTRTDDSIDLSNGNLTAYSNEGDPGIYGSSFATVSRTTGRWYWEVVVDVLDTQLDLFVGVIRADAVVTNRFVDVANQPRYAYRATGDRYASGTTSGFASFTVGDVVGVAWDADTDEIWYSKNGAWQSGDPSTGTSPASSGNNPTVEPLRPGIGYDNNVGVAQVTARFSQSQWTYTAPTGFAQLTDGTEVEPVPEVGVGSAGVGGYMLDTRQSGNGLIELSYHAAAAAVDIEQDALNFVLDQYDEPGPAESSDLVIGTNERYVFNAGTINQRYQWDSKLFLLPHPMALQWARVRALDYGDVTISFYADDVLLYSKVVTSNKAFRIRVRSDYSRMTYSVLGTSEVYSVQISDDVDELE
jgi:carbon monoxide dehydrogenase subunit G